MLCPAVAGWQGRYMNVMPWQFPDSQLHSFAMRPFFGVLTQLDANSALARFSGICTNMAKKFRVTDGSNHYHTTTESKVVVHPGSM